MRKIKVEEAVGQTLCHDMTAILENGYKGVRFKRGHLISEEDIPVLKDMGKDHIFVWEPDANEVHEEDAAQILSEAMCGDHVVKSAPSEGKIGFTSCVSMWMPCGRSIRYRIIRWHWFPTVFPWKPADDWVEPASFLW